MKNINLPEPSLTWFGHASFFFKDENGNKIYFVDPFQLNKRAKEKADLIFITHAHPDHFSPKDLDEIIKEDTVVIAPFDILAKIERDDSLKQAVEPNKTYNVKGFKFSTIPAYNNHPDRLNFHPKANNWVGYIFDINGKKIYHAGDSDFIDEMKSLKNLNLDIAMLPIGGTYTMHAEEAAEAANAIAAKITIPMHYKAMNQGNHVEVEEIFKKLVVNSKVVILEELK
jgi:L-ascorbate metabolism protein UlaG (beta-lactamase superfamily)